MRENCIKFAMYRNSSTLIKRSSVFFVDFDRKFNFKPVCSKCARSKSIIVKAKYRMKCDYFLLNKPFKPFAQSSLCFGLDGVGAVRADSNNALCASLTIGGSPVASGKDVVKAVLISASWLSVNCLDSHLR